MKYDIEYFIQKFEKIPDYEWCTGEVVDEKGKKCALGHCGVRTKTIEDTINPWSRTKEGDSLIRLFGGKPELQDSWEIVWSKNDDPSGNPKNNILSYLYDIKESII